MKFKKGVDPRYLSSPAWHGLYLSDLVHRKLYKGQEATCTSTGDSRHSVERSRHYTGAYGLGFCNAFDLRTWAAGPHGEEGQEAREVFAKELREMLGDDYVVLAESNHIHVHWAPVYRSN